MQNFTHICLSENFLYLNDKNVLYPKVSEIVWKHIENDENNICLIGKKLIETRKIFQFVFSKTHTRKSKALLKNVS